MVWLVLIFSGALEAVWAGALNSMGERLRVETLLLFVGAMALSLSGLGVAMRSIPIGTAYAVWVGVGAVVTVAYGILALGDPAGVLRLACIGLIIVGIAGLNFA